ncbi:NCS1 family nucleobase:cation symporter-1 [Vulcanisaeta thermophila]|uniref:NCS1 family nucleobase:cation symporter-1 n=1 Tax=Vulcanisaeta thermophila TaxID=867917 RepID=UPI0008531BE0|nr:cytosine permease [Vulcanisaeta thermophila]
MGDDVGKERAKDRVQAVKYDAQRGQVELIKEYPEEKWLWNKDFHPIAISKRTWDWYTYAAIWFGMTFIVPSWSLASVGLVFGLGTWDSLLAIFLGNAIVLIPMIIESHAGARYGLAEPQLARTRWGIYGAIFPSWIRAVIGAGWWGIESYIMTEAAVGIYAILAHKLDIIQTLVDKGIANPFTLSIAFPQIFWITFALIIIFQLLLLYFSPVPEAQPALKWFARSAAPLVLLGFITIWIYFMTHANWHYTKAIISPTISGPSYWIAWLAFLNANIAYWATMAISMPDYTRFAKSQFAQTVGQIPMPLMMLAVGILGVMTTGAIMHLYHRTIWDPILVSTLYLPTGLAIFLNVIFLLATFSVNVFANTVGPAYDFANTFPRYLTWFRGVLIVVLVSIALGAWTFYGNAYGYLYSWLLTYGGLLGSVEGIIIFDYALIRRFKFDITDVFWSRGRFRYWRGINPAAFITFAIVEFIIYAPFIPYHSIIFSNSWLISFALSGIIYTPLMVYWVIPKYQPVLRGSIWKEGYLSDEVRQIFNVKSK